MKIRYTNLVGLLSLLGTIIGLILAGTLHESSSLLAAPFVLLAIASFFIFLKFLYHFLKYSPLGDIPDEEAREAYMDHDDFPPEQDKNK
ncbi:hypothetical protein [Methanooceanicella nereidis]|uniref:hypothetical protein n=1 Tax=Methanooceanicella nereidis TaxID=2052831 RepID=UPI001E63BE58|nr:hypothetical protein [Methanocella sp. CWC-04]